MNVFNNRTIIAPDRRELWGGLGCFVAYLLAIPMVVSLFFAFSEDSLRTDFLYDLSITVCSFLLILAVFRNFLFRSGVPIGLLLMTCLFGFLGYRALDSLWWILLLFIQGFLPELPTNMNQELVEEFLRNYRGYMILNVVVLAPFVEEILFRGVIFAPMCKKRPFLAYVASIVAFAGLHVVGFIGYQPWWMLLFSFLQYIPAAFVLCWSYQRSCSIWAPILLHGIMNLVSSVGI